MVVAIPTRAQLDRIANGDQRLLDALEALFDFVQQKELSVEVDNPFSSATPLMLSGDSELPSPVFVPSKTNGPSVDYIDFSRFGPHVTKALRMQWNENDGTIDVGLNDNVILQIGQEIHYYAKNTSGATIANGSPVVATGVVGASGKLTIGPAIGDGTYASRFFIGAATEDIANNAFGYVSSFGLVRGFDTSAWAEGDLLYVSATTAGAWTNTQPTAPNWKEPQAIVINSGSGGSGSILVRREPEGGIENLRDVDGTPAAGDLLRFNGTLWEVTSPTGWAAYVHGGGAQSLSASTRTQLQIDGATKIETQLPSDSGPLWDDVNDKITGRNGDSIVVKIQGVFTPSDATASNLKLDVDIGGSVGIVEKQDFPITNGAGVAHDFSWTFLAYTLDTWEANGGAVYATSDGAGGVTGLRIIITRTHRAN